MIHDRNRVRFLTPKLIARVILFGLAVPPLIAVIPLLMNALLKQAAGPTELDLGFVVQCLIVVLFAWAGTSIPSLLCILALTFQASRQIRREPRRSVVLRLSITGAILGLITGSLIGARVPVSWQAVLIFSAWGILTGTVSAGVLFLVLRSRLEYVMRAAQAFGRREAARCGPRG